VKAWRRKRRAQALSIVGAATATVSAVAVNLATEWKNNGWAWALVVLLTGVTATVALRAVQPARAGGRSVLSSQLRPGFFNRQPETIQMEATGLHLEYVDESPSGERVYSRAYTLESARILAESRLRRADQGGGRDV
jgi:hypothetical protein